MLPIGSSLWRHFRSTCKDYRVQACGNFFKSLALIVSEIFTKTISWRRRLRRTSTIALSETRKRFRFKNNSQLNYVQLTKPLNFARFEKRFNRENMSLKGKLTNVHRIAWDTGHYNPVMRTRPPFRNNIDGDAIFAGFCPKLMWKFNHGKIMTENGATRYFRSAIRSTTSKACKLRLCTNREPLKWSFAEQPVNIFLSLNEAITSQAVIVIISIIRAEECSEVAKITLER